jgi:hypothetical protein
MRPIFPRVEIAGSRDPAISPTLSHVQPARAAKALPAAGAYDSDPEVVPVPSKATGRLTLQSTSSAPVYAVQDGSYTIHDGGTASTGGMTFIGGLYISGTLTISAGDVTGLAAVATSGDYADITGGPPATTTVAASYDSGTKDLTITVNGVSTTVNLT